MSASESSGESERGKELHHARIGVHRLKWNAVGVAPAAQQKTFSFDRVAHEHSNLRSQGPGLETVA